MPTHLKISVWRTGLSVQSFLLPSAVSQVIMKLFAHQVTVFTVFSWEMKNIHGAHFLRTTSRRKILHLLCVTDGTVTVRQEAFSPFCIKSVGLWHCSEVYLLLTLRSPMLIICPTRCNIKKTALYAYVLFFSYFSSNSHDFLRTIHWLFCLTGEQCFLLCTNRIFVYNAINLTLHSLVNERQNFALVGTNLFTVFCVRN
jgi:hypothetical protein